MTELKLRVGNISYSQPKHMLWVLKRTISLRRLFSAPKTYAKITGKILFTILR